MKPTENDMMSHIDMVYNEFIILFNRKGLDEKGIKAVLKRVIEDVYEDAYDEGFSLGRDEI